MKLRLIGPFVMSLFLCFVFVDYLSFLQDKRSFLRGFWSLLGVFATAVIHWLTSLPFLLDSGFVIPGGIAIFGLALVWFALREAKKAMSHATGATSVAPNENVQPLTANTTSEPAVLSEPELLPARGGSLGFVGKIVGAFAVIAVIFCLLSLLSVYFFLRPALETQIKKRSSFIALELSATTAGYIAQKNLGALRAHVSRYVSRQDVAYVVVEDHEGKVLAQGPGNPSVLGRSALQEPSEQLSWSPAFYQQRPVNEARIRLGEGQAGYLSVGFWADDAEREMNWILWPLACFIVALLIVVILLSAMFLRRIIRYFHQVVLGAERISEGNLEIGISVRPKDEIGEVARSLERMRSSLKAVMTRLKQNEPPS